MLSFFISSNSFAYQFSYTKKQAKKIWADHRESFYCGCTFDKHLSVHHASCSYTPIDKRRAKKIEWEHLVPVSWFGHHRSCWENAKYNKRDPRSHCEKIDPVFKIMLHDLHNLVPAIGEVNKARSNYGFTTLETKTLFNGCEITIDKNAKKVEPKDSIKGTIARVHLYMEQTYGENEFRLSAKQREQYLDWHKRFPPSAWEKTWNKRVFNIQGKNNSFIDP